MAKPWEKKEFSSWARALEAGVLGPEHIETLDQMVRAGEAADRKEAAQRLDWTETVIDPDEHMYGF
jgi:serine/threonine-protein kinase RIO1